MANRITNQQLKQQNEQLQQQEQLNNMMATLENMNQNFQANQVALQQILANQGGQPQGPQLPQEPNVPQDPPEVGYAIYSKQMHELEHPTCRKCTEITTQRHKLYSTQSLCNQTKNMGKISEKYYQS